MAGKKPVWVDEDAHAILKKFAKLTRNSMVEVASALVLDKLSQLDPASGLEPVSADPVVDLSRPQTIAQKPVSVNRSVSARKPRPKREKLDPNDANVRFVGGIWLV